MIARLVVLAALVAAAPAWAQSEGACRSSARDVERELVLRGDKLSSTDRLVAEQRLSLGEGLCTRDSGRADRDLEQLRRDIIQQANRPPAVPPPGALPPGALQTDRY